MIREWINNALVFGMEAQREGRYLSDEEILNMARYLSENPTASFQDYLSMRLYQSSLFGEESNEN
jgi:hypothetical protein